jgi:hypothetical protein
MAQNPPVKTPAVLWIGVIVLVVLAVGAVGYLVSTFLFAFSGGQYRMVEVVNLGALAVIAVGVITAAALWKLRSPVAGVVGAAMATGVAWIIAMIAEWVLSFSLGAG